MELYRRSLFRDDWNRGKKKAVDAELKKLHGRTSFPHSREEFQQYKQEAIKVIEETSAEFRSNYIEPKYTRDELLIEIAKRLKIDLIWPPS